MPDAWRVEIVGLSPAEEIPTLAKRELKAVLEELEESGSVAGAKPMSGYKTSIASSRMGSRKAG